MSYAPTRHLSRMLMIGLTLVSAYSPALAAGTTTLTLASPGGDSISDLQWRSRRLIIGVAPSQLKRGQRVRLKGVFKRPNWSLAWKDQLIETDPAGNFDIDALIGNAPKQSEALLAVGPYGEVEVEQVLLMISGSNDKMSSRVTKNSSMRKPLSFTPSLGLTYWQFDQTGLASIRQVSVTAKASIRYLIAPPAWDIGGSAFVTGFKLTSNVPSASLRMIGVNLRIGYMFPFIRAPWQLSIAGGGYFNAIQSSDSRYGYPSVAGPQLYPVIRRIFSKGQSASLYLKFSPVMEVKGLDARKFENNEKAFGLSWAHPLTNGRSFGIGYDYTKLSMFISSRKGKGGRETFTSTTSTINLSYSF